MEHASPYVVDPIAPVTAFARWIGRVTTCWLPKHPATDFLEYWVYDFVKVATLLVITSFLLGVVRRVAGIRWLRRGIWRSDWKGIVMGAVLGVFTPVCSCSVTPLYASLLQAGASRQAAAAFLFAAPAVNEFAIVVMMVAVGWQGALLYLLLGLSAAVVTGRYATQLGLTPCERCNLQAMYSAGSDRRKSLYQHARDSLHEAIALLRRLSLPMVWGTALAAFLANYNLRPLEVMLGVGWEWWSPVVAALIGMPLDVNAAATLPLVLPLAEVGIPLGTLVALMMAVTLASLPEGMVLRSIVGWRGVARTALWYFSYCALIGVLINWSVV